MDRDIAVKMWEEAWSDGVWYASWQSAISGLNALQAAWKPQPDRHSIWQIVNQCHMGQIMYLRALQGFDPIE